MAIQGYADLDATELARLIGRGELSALEVLEKAVERAERVNPRLNALVYPWYDHAKERIREGLPQGPFHGVPFLLKDLYQDYEGQKQSNGCRALAGTVAGQDGEMVSRYKAAGLSIFGRTASPEFGLSTTTESALHGQTRNPWNPELTSGGSSGGASSMVAAGVLPMANASDGGGSIRVPASCTGLFGLKPTRGRNPMGPLVGEGWSGLATVHAISRSVRDSALLLDCTAGPDLGAPYWAEPPERPFLEEVGREVAGMRAAVLREAWFGVETHPDCLEAVDRAAGLCRGLGLEVEEASLPIPRELLDADMQIIYANARETVELVEQVLGRPATEEDVEKNNLAMARRDRSTGADYVRALNGIHVLGRLVARFFLDFDLLITPTMPVPPMPLGLLSPSREDAEAQWRDVMRTIAFTSVFNASGNPAASVPLHWNRDGLPIGVQFVAPYGDEAGLFRIASALEEAAPWAHRRPPIHAG
ncbi:MAG: amidase [Alphaproteobacteria bacterium]|nr:amidase [Alphaproteobacteria bacterium]